MHLRSYLVLFLFLGFFVQHSTAQKQKIKIKNQVATIDGVEYVQWKKVSGANAVSVHEIGSGKEVIFLRWLSYNDPGRVTNSNPKGDV